jgi:hypothetical protein
MIPSGIRVGHSAFRSEIPIIMVVTDTMVTAMVILTGVHLITMVIILTGEIHTTADTTVIMADIPTMIIMVTAVITAMVMEDIMATITSRFIMARAVQLKITGLPMQVPIHGVFPVVHQLQAAEHQEVL